GRAATRDVNRRDRAQGGPDGLQRLLYVFQEAARAARLQGATPQDLRSEVVTGETSSLVGRAGGVNTPVLRRTDRSERFAGVWSGRGDPTGSPARSLHSSAGRRGSSPRWQGSPPASAAWPRAWPRRCAA